MKNFVFVKSEKSLVKVKFEDIWYIKADKDYVYIFTPKQTFCIHMTMQNLEDQLPSRLFIRIHRSYIINVEHLVMIKAYFAHITTGKIIPISETHYQNLLRHVNYLKSTMESRKEMNPDPEMYA